MNPVNQESSEDIFKQLDKVCKSKEVANSVRILTHIIKLAFLSYSPEERIQLIKSIIIIGKAYEQEILPLLEKGNPNEDRTDNNNSGD